MKTTFLRLSAAIVCSLTIASCGSKKANNNQGNAAVPVNIYDVHLQPAYYYDEYPATVTALSQVDLHAEVEGYVTGIFFKEGDHVRKGQKLYEIDRSKYMASYDQAMASVRVAQANEDQAQKDANRYTYLNEHDAIAKQTLDHAMTTLQNAKNQVTAAKQDLIKAQTDLRFATITAPFDGTIGLSQVKLGTLVTPGQTVLNTISTDNPMGVDFVINEKEVSRFVKLQQHPNQMDSLFTIRTPDNELYSYPGKISVVDRGVDPQTGTIKVRVVFPNPDFMLRSGMSCTMRVHNEDTGLQILIPNKATIEQMGEYFVFVAKDTVIKDEDKKGNNEQGQHALAAVQKKVMLGRTINDQVVVKNGLSDGERLITDGIQKLHDGSLVTVGSPTQATQQGAQGKK